MPQNSTAQNLQENRALYVQVADAIVDYIRENDLKPGDRLPSQNIMMKKYQVSQSTVRQALLNLSNQGLVVAHQGKGVFVARPRVWVDLSRPLITSKDGRGQSGLNFEFISAELVFAPERVAELLGVEVGTQITRYRRKIFAGQELIGMETANVSLSIARIFSETDLRKGDFLPVLARDQSTAIAKIDLTIGAGCITDFDAELLEVASDQTVLQRIEICRANSDQPILMTRTILFADRIDLSSEVNFSAGENHS